MVLQNLVVDRGQRQGTFVSVRRRLWLSIACIPSERSPAVHLCCCPALQNLVAITNAIRDAGLNLNPSHDDKVVKVPVPKPSKESRDASIKLASKIANDAKETVRRVRQDALDKLKKVDGACAVLCCCCTACSRA